MKKTFTFFAISALFLMLLFPVSVKADPVATLSFVYTSAGDDKYCNGNASESGKGAVGGDFQWSDKIGAAIEKSGDWIGVNGNTTACSRSTVRLDATGGYTFTMDVKWTEHGNRNLPRITITGQSEKTPDMGSSVYFDDNDTKTIVYTFNGLAAGDYEINVSFPDGARDKQFVQTLVISSSAPAAPTYEVSVNATNGTVSGTGSFEAGATVTLTPSADTDYSFSGWSSVSGVDLTGHLNDNPLIFAMPGNEVSLTANFTACTKHTVTLADDGHGSTSGGGEFCEGSVTVTATPNSGYRFVNWTNTLTSAEVSTNAVYTFDLSADIGLTANFEVDPCSNSLTIQCEDETIYRINSSLLTKGKPTPTYGTSHSYYSGADGDYVDFKGTDGEHYYMVHLPAATYSFTVYKAHAGNSWLNIWEAGLGDALTYNGVNYGKHHGDGYDIIGDNEGYQDKPIHNSTVSNITLTEGDYIIGLYGNEWAAFDKIVITATSNVFCNYTITMADGVNGGNPTSDVASAAEGATVTVTAGEPESGYYFSGWSALPSVTFSDASTSPATFTMPASNVTITANYSEIISSTFTYTTSGSGSITCATKSGSKVNSGTTIEMTAVPSDDYVFTGWTAMEGPFSDDAALTTTFTMPAVDAEVTATFAQVDNIICYGVESGSAGDVVGGGATISGSNIQDFDAFDGNNIVKLSYEGMSGSSAYASWDILKSNTYNSANSAGATGFGFYYKTEAADDKVAMWFEPNTGGQQALQLNGTSNVWKYVYFAHSAAATWNQSQIRIYINGEQEGKSTANANGAIYLAAIAATSITSKPEINTYIYTRTNASNSYGTLCLPMDGLVSGATLYSVAGKQEEGGKLYIVLEEQGTTLAAGEPYIFEADGLTLTATMSGAHSDVKADANGLVGTYQQITAPAYSEPNGLLNYILALDNSTGSTVFKKVGEKVTVGAYRAYINIQNADNYSPASAAPGRKYIRFGIEGTEEEQAVEMIYDDASLRTRKIMQNGHLYILRDGHLFTAQGTQIK